MEEHIVCPNCNRVITNKSIISEAAKGEGSAEQSLTCDCGERLSYWQITAQLRNQKTTVNKLKTWARTLFRSQA